MLKPDYINRHVNPEAKLRTHVKPGDTVILNLEERTMKIVRFDNEKGFIPLNFPVYQFGFPKGDGGDCIKLPPGVPSLVDFFNFLLSVINLVAEKVEISQEQGDAISPNEEHWLLKEHPEDEYHG